MIIAAFLRWTETAPAADRAKAAGSLARAFVERTLAVDDRQAAEVALTYLLDDPSPKVRLAIADVMAQSTEAPRAIIHALSRDQIEVAGRIVAFSPLLSDADLVDLVGEDVEDLQRLVALRTGLSRSVAAAIAEVAGAEPICDLLQNRSAAIAPFSLRRIAERFSADTAVRALLVERDDLPADVRHRLMGAVATALSQFDLVRNVIGERRAERVVTETQMQATLTLAGDGNTAALPGLAEHLRGEGRLTPALLMQALASGKLDFFVAAVVAISGQPEARVRAIVVDGRVPAIRALYGAIGLPGRLLPVFISATLVWRDASSKGRIATPSHLARTLIELHQRDAAEHPEVAELLTLVEKLNLAHRRQCARADALALASVRAA